MKIGKQVAGLEMKMLVLYGGMSFSDSQQYHVRRQVQSWGVLVWVPPSWFSGLPFIGFYHA